MYKITLFYQSNENGIYTKVEETATDLRWANIKRDRMLNRWFSIICPHINFGRCMSLLYDIGIRKNSLDYSEEKIQDEFNVKYDLIQQHIKTAHTQAPLRYL